MTECEEQIQEILKKEHFSFDDLCSITSLLRGEGGCPWDREQTHESIRRCMIEEAYEVAEAIDKKDPVLLCEELGDVLFQVVFHAELEREAGRFSRDEVVDGICRKMIRRHPHVFGTSTAVNGKDALAQWEAIKTEEKQRRTLSSRLRSIPPILPALLRAQKVREKIGTSADRIDEELTVAAARFSSDPNEKTLGEMLYVVAGIAAVRGFDAEGALSKTVENAIETVEKGEFPEKN